MSEEKMSITKTVNIATFPIFTGESTKYVRIEYELSTARRLIIISKPLRRAADTLFLLLPFIITVPFTARTLYFCILRKIKYLRYAYSAYNIIFFDFCQSYTEKALGCCSATQLTIKKKRVKISKNSLHLMLAYRIFAAV